jgi:outer membrane protein W
MKSRNQSRKIASPSLLLLCAYLGASLFYAVPARAGFVEIGISGSVKKTTIDTNAYDQSQALTGSFTYYLDESSALELSYTDGVSKRAIAEGQPNGHVTSMFYSVIGLDFIYTLGDREAPFRPYLKAGANYILEKRIVDQYRGPDGNLFDPTTVKENPSLVPSAGVGMKISLTKNLSLKAGVDIWSSGPINQKPLTFDYAGRAGVSLMF